MAKLSASEAMRDLDDALADISTIRAQIARSSLFRGYGPATVGATGLLAIAASFAQPRLIAAPLASIEAYLALWIGTAVLGIAVTGAEMIVRARRLHGSLANEMLAAAVEQFLPALGVGALLTVVLVVRPAETAWLLPGLWQVVFALGVFASGRFLPRGIFWIGGWYLLSGLSALMLARGEHALSPAAMGIGFGVGQLATAAILYRAREEASSDA
jgi:hypothetical protein